MLDVARGRSRAATVTRDVGAAGPPSLDVETIGAGLADALLAGDLEAAYTEARHRAAAAGRGLRLTLSLGAAPRLLSLPWEFLYRRPRFFANQRQTPLVRHLETQALPGPPAIDQIVRVLGVVASPRELGPLDVGAERARMEQAIEKVAALGRVELDWLEPATPRDCARLSATAATTSSTTSGTATSRPPATACSSSRTPTARSAEVDSTELANLLADQTSLRLVVLNSCEGARTTLTDPYAGVATTLVQLGVPAVVAMQFEISDAAAILFAEELYVNLIGRQDPIDAAVAEARKAIYVEQGGGIEWATPVLFMGDVDVELFDFEIEAAPLPPPPPPNPIPWGITVEPKNPVARRARRQWSDRGRRGARAPRAGRRAGRRPADRPHRDRRRRHPRHHRRARRGGRRQPAARSSRWRTVTTSVCGWRNASRPTGRPCHVDGATNASPSASAASRPAVPLRPDPSHRGRTARPTAPAA